MGCGGSTGDKKIKFLKTKLGDIDTFVDKCQDVVDSVYNIQDPIEEKKENFLRSTKVWEL
jgi:hypothetical protein